MTNSKFCHYPGNVEEGAGLANVAKHRLTQAFNWLQGAIYRDFWGIFLFLTDVNWVGDNPGPSDHGRGKRVQIKFKAINPGPDRREIRRGPRLLIDHLSVFQHEKTSWKWGPCLEAKFTRSSYLVTHN